MNRDLIINTLLILAGILLAFALFGAGVFWKSRRMLRMTGVVTFDLGLVVSDR
jgi:hypothetical protein